MRPMNIEMKPGWLMKAGLAMMALGSVFAGVAGSKIPKIIDEHKEKKAGIDPEDKKAIRKETAKTAGKVAVAVLPAVACEVVGTKCITEAYDIVKDFGMKASAAAAATASILGAYRQRVSDRWGEEAEHEIWYGTKKEKIEITEVDEKNKVKTVKKTVEVAEAEPLGYARYFAYGESVAAEKNIDYNKTFLKGIESSFNHKLEIQGYAWLNDLYEACGFAISEAGQHVGWVLDRNRTDHGDNCVDLRIREVYRMNDQGVYEPVLMIDPNVDGEITEHLIELGLMTL